MTNNKEVSAQSHEQAMAIAKGTQKPGQNKEQTKLIAAGIEKGIAQYKKQHKVKMREQDKQRKKLKKTSSQSQKTTELVAENEPATVSAKLPWSLLLVSWVGFASYLLFVV